MFQLCSLCQFGIPVHEIGHALGFWHEQQRRDRGDHINIIWDSLGKYRSQYYTSDTVNFGVPYDLSSVMHYAPYVSIYQKFPFECFCNDKASASNWQMRATFILFLQDGSINAQKVIEAKNPLFQQTLGQRVELSFSDKKLINKAYCSGKNYSHSLSLVRE